MTRRHGPLTEHSNPEPTTEAIERTPACVCRWSRSPAAFLTESVRYVLFVRDPVEGGGQTIGKCCLTVLLSRQSAAF